MHRFNTLFNDIVHLRVKVYAKFFKMSLFESIYLNHYCVIFEIYLFNIYTIKG